LKLPFGHFRRRPAGCQAKSDWSVIKISGGNSRVSRPRRIGLMPAEPADTPWPDTRAGDVSTSAAEPAVPCPRSRRFGRCSCWRTAGAEPTCVLRERALRRRV